MQTFWTNPKKTLNSRPKLRVPFRIVIVLFSVCAASAFTGCRTFPKYEAPASEEQVLKRMRTNVDDVDRIRWYHHNSLDPLFADDMPLELYIGQSLDNPSQVWMRFYVYWSGDSWLFIDSITLTADGTLFNLRGLDFKGYVHSTGTVSETFDTRFNVEHQQFIRALTRSSIATLRLRGERGVSDFAITDKHRVALSDLMTAYRVLKSR